MMMIPVMVDGVIVGRIARPNRPYERYHEFPLTQAPRDQSALPEEPGPPKLSERVGMVAHYYDADGFPGMLEKKTAYGLDRLPGFEPVEAV